MTPEEAKQELKRIASNFYYSEPIINKILDDIERNPEFISIGVKDFYNTGTKNDGSKPHISAFEEFKLSTIFDPITGIGVYVRDLVKKASNENIEYSGIPCPFDSFIFVRKDCLEKYKNEL